MTELLPGMEGEKRKPELSQWFTPPDLAQRIVTWALAPWYEQSRRWLRVLEPSAGRGALAIPLSKLVSEVLCYEIDPQNAEWLTSRVTTICCDFLAMPEGIDVKYDMAVMNPPFEGGQTEKHIMHALKFADRVVCHCPLTTLAGQARGENLWSKVHLHRLAICSSRPSYGGKGGATDMCTVDVTLLDHREKRDATDVEWWP